MRNIPGELEVPLESIRKQFPSLERTYQGNCLAYFDGPGGSQVPSPVIDAISWYYQTCNANLHGTFITSQETEQVIQRARDSAAAFLNATSPKNISFGANMTSLNFALSRAIGRHLTPGDQILVTQLDHEANRGPWYRLSEFGIQVREVLMNQDGTLDYDDFGKKLTDKTKLVAVGHASNLLGTVNDIAWIRNKTKDVGAWLLLDGVHYAPHFSIDVQELGAEFYLCSAYKFYGPHIGILYCKDEVLDQLDPDRLSTQVQSSPTRIETGTLNHACLNGVSAAIEFISRYGKGASLRSRLISAMDLFAKAEETLARQLYSGLCSIPGVEIYGPDFNAQERTPTISFSIRNKHPREIAKFLGDQALMLMHGHFYAARAVEILGRSSQGGVVRAGISIYNSSKEVNRLLEAVETISNVE